MVSYVFDNFTRARLLQIWWVALISLAAAALVGCAPGNPHAPGTYARGLLFHEQGRHTEAVASLETFVRYNPTDSLAAQAQFLKAMSYMEMKEYPLAAVELQILVKDYPTSDLVEEAQFMEGMAYFNQVRGPERDVSGALEARRHFLQFAQTYPQSKHMDEVISTMQDISDLMVEKRLKQVHVFRQLKQDEAVLVTLEGVLEKEANSRLLDQVLFERGRAAARLDRDRLAREMYSRLVREYPESRYVKQAQSALDDLLPGGEGQDD